MKKFRDYYHGKKRTEGEERGGLEKGKKKRRRRKTMRDCYL